MRTPLPPITTVAAAPRCSARAPACAASSPTSPLRSTPLRPWPGARAWTGGNSAAALAAARRGGARTSGRGTDAGAAGLPSDRAGAAAALPDVPAPGAGRDVLRVTYAGTAPIDLAT